jgi:dTDP-4-amino-4,6-dideoxygalactose transaminase
MIVLNKAFRTGKEIEYVSEALRGQTSGNGVFTKKCHQFFKSKYGFNKNLLTTSCTDALEMAAILSNIKPGDEVIIPSFTFVSTANAFLLRGAKIVFADSRPDHPNLDVSRLEGKITSKTKAIVAVHYAGVAVDMQHLMALALKYNLLVIEDAAQAIDSFFLGRPLGSIGHFGCFSFHDTKNIVSGEGGLLVVNERQFVERAEILWEKGTNRSAFIRGEVDKYGWVDVGSSFLPSELTAAYLLAQLEHLDVIQNKRHAIWNRYYAELLPVSQSLGFELPIIPESCKHNAHIFYLVCASSDQRNYLSAEMKAAGVQAYFHYPPLHLSKFHLQSHRPEVLPNALRFSEQLVRLPIYPDLSPEDQAYVIDQIKLILKKFNTKNSVLVSALR